jgi:hypothetical protein
MVELLWEMGREEEKIKILLVNNSTYVLYVKQEIEIFYH